MKTLRKIQLIVIITFFSTINVIAQEWTKEQLEVWQVVEESWALSSKFDIVGLKAYYHDQFQGWDGNSPLPSSKELLFRNYSGMAAYGFNIDWYALNPARIVVTDKAAVVDYYYSYLIAAPNATGEIENSMVSGKLAYFFIKQEGKWLLLGAMGVNDPNEE